MYLRFKRQYLEIFPVPDFETYRRDLEKLAEQMMTATTQVASATTDKDRTYYENKCAALDGQIDRLVYELYGLTEDEIAIIETQTTR